MTTNSGATFDPKSGLPAGHESQSGDFSTVSGRVTSSSEAENDDSIQRLQVAQVMRAIPLFLLFHASAALSIHNLTDFASAFALARVWLVAVVLTGFALGLAYLLWRAGRLHEKPTLVLRGLEVLCLLLGLVWAIPAASAVYMPEQNLVYPIVGVSLAVLGIVVSSLMRVPTGAVVFVGIVSAAVARSLYVMADEYSLMATLVCSIYGLVLIGIVINSHMDFLSRARAEMEVKRQNEVIRLLLNDLEREAEDWLWETDTEGRLTYFSSRFAALLNDTPENLQLRPLRHVLADHARNEGWRKLESAMSDKATVTDLDLELLVNGKPVVWQFTARTMQNDQTRFQGYRGVIRDVTASHEAQRRIEIAKETSEKASAAKSQFLAIISHELRTPINAIMGFSELLAQDKNEMLPQKTRIEFAETILQSSKELQYLINNILDTTRMDRGSLQLNEQEVDAAELVEIAIKHCRTQAEKAQVSIVGRLTDGVSLQGDSVRLKQVMVNLIANAIKFSPPGGIINVDMQKGLQGQFVLAIKDAGIGIPTADLERVFEPFVQADDGLSRRFGGAGLGLSIARRIARLHGGDVALESVTGAGTTASLILPTQRMAWPKRVASDVSKVA